MGKKDGMRGLRPGVEGGFRGVVNLRTKRSHPISNPTFDLFIVGGGINGAALADLAAAQGVSTALAEAGDFGAGASSNTSKLVHGGLRYLETGSLSLVRDAVRERAHLLALAPHLVRPERFFFPLGGFGRHGRWAVKAGLWLYDALAGSLRLRPHGYVTPAEFRAAEPGFLPGERVAAYTYSDCVMDDARLTLETVLDAEAKGARVWNYRRVTALEPADGAWEITLEDRFTGRETVLTARRVALALGPWTDSALRQWRGESGTRVRLSQGSHLLIEGLPAASCFLLPVPGSRRYFFVIPFRGLHLVGTTEVELPTGADPNRGISPEEKAELLALVRRYFPGAAPQVRATFTGVRPLAGGGGSTVTLSREHVFHKLPDGLYAAVGGKYTTHRVLARDFFCFIFGRKKKDVPLSDQPYPGAYGAGGPDALLQKLAAAPSGPPAAWPRWAVTYGARSLELADFIAAHPRSGRAWPGEGGFCEGEVLFSREREHCRTAVDFFRRRTGAYFSAGAGLENLAAVESVLAPAAAGASAAAPAAWGEETDYRAFLQRHEHRALAP